MELNSFRGKMPIYFNELSNYLVSFLQKNLPLHYSKWWEDGVLEKLHENQLFFVKQRKISTLSELDLAALLRILLMNWYQINSKNLFLNTDRNYIKEMQSIRNKWAHINNDALEIDDIYRDLDTLQRVANIVDADKEFIEKLKTLKRELTSPSPSPTQELEPPIIEHIIPAQIIQETQAKSISPSYTSETRDYITIKGVKIYTERFGNDSERYFIDTITKLLQVLNQEDILLLQDISYSRHIIKLGTSIHPLISKDKNQMYDGSGRFRAYSSLIAGYWVFAQWTKTNLPHWKNFLKKLEAKYAGSSDKIQYYYPPSAQSAYIGNRIDSSPVANKNRDFITIKGIRIFTEREENNSKAYFEDTIPKLVQVLPESEIENLQDIHYCLDVVQTNIKQYPVLSQNKNQMIDRDGRMRSYSKTIADFWVSAQWNVNNLQMWKNYLKMLEVKYNKN